MPSPKSVVGPTPGQMMDFYRRVGQGSISSEQFQVWLDSLGKDLSVAIWAKVYDLLGLTKEFQEFAQANADKLQRLGLWTVPVIKGATPNKVVAAFRQLGVDVDVYANNLDADVTTNDRDPNNGSYVINFRQNVEADEDLKGLSANVLAQRQTKAITITLLERLLLGLAYFMATGKLLDEKVVTLCSGSRSSGGGVPGVGSGSDRRGGFVSRCHPGHADDALRARSAV